MYSSTLYNENTLNNLKVVELKKLISELPASKKKGSSAIRKKADLVEFLAAYYNDNEIDTKKVEVVEVEEVINKEGERDAMTIEEVSRSHPADTAGATNNNKAANDISGKRIRSMPALQLQDTADYIHKLVCERYPQIDPSNYEDENTPEFGGLGEFDIR